MRHLIWVVSFALACAPPPRAVTLPDDAAPVTVGTDLTARRVAPDAWVITHAKPWPANALLHRTPAGQTILVSTPYTPEATRELLQWVRTTFGRNPVAAVNSHFHFDGSGGNAALREAGVPAYGTLLTARLMQERGEAVRQQTARALASDAVSAARFRDFVFVPPDRLLSIEGERSMRLGGETVVVAAPGPAHSPDNLAVYFPRTGVLFAGCMVRTDGRLGNLGDADVDHWPAAMRALRKYAARVVIPGHGLRFDPAMIEETENAAARR
jgi:metallo-beta-lactamase class B